MPYIGQVWRVRPGKAEDYRRAHETIWPELETLFHRSGVTHYVIYAWGELLFSHMEVDDYEAMIERFNATEIGREWEVEAMGDLVEYPEVDPATGWPSVLDEVWHLPPARKGGGRR
ncbi:MAG: L-rhamnose mutarotase [Actinobacteria bacterium]|nr:L-rhamnose mutarotase [Actinomycetota bacterium]